MKDEISVTFEGNYVQAISDGEKTFERAEQVWTEIVRVCRKHNCFAVLGISRSMPPVTVHEGFDHAELFERLGITQQYRIAWVELHREAQNTFLFIETVLVNRGLPGRVFHDISEAKRWLLGSNRAG